MDFEGEILEMTILGSNKLSIHTIKVMTLMKITFETLNSIGTFEI